MPIATIAVPPACSTHSPAASMTDSHNASASCSTQPGRGNAIDNGREALPLIAPVASTSRALVFVVPWSMAKMSFARDNDTLLYQLRGGPPDALRRQTEMLEQECGRSGRRKL